MSSSLTSIGIDFFIKYLPEDIIKQIWLEHIKPKLLLSKLDTILDSTESHNLNSKNLDSFIRRTNILENKFVVEYLLKNDRIFKTVYQQHIIKKIQQFVLFPDLISSMSQSWLMYLYH